MAERLPWYLNGTLSGSERDAVRAHLAHCAKCQAELEETRQAAALFGTHLAPEVLLDLAWERALGSEDALAAERHVASCRECSDELAAARESRALEAGPREAPARRAARRTPVWLGAGLAATLLLGFTSGNWWGGARQAADLATARDSGRRAAERAEALQAQASRVDGLERRLSELSQPQTDAAFVELLPRDAVRGGAASAFPSVAPRGAFSVLSLVADAPASYASYRLTASTTAGDALWVSEGLKRQTSGEFLVLVPSSQLAPGRMALRLEGRRGERWERLATYTLDVRAPAAR